MTESTIIINIGIYKTLSLIGVLITGAWYLSHRLTKIETKFEGFDKRLTWVEDYLFRTKDRENSDK